MTSKTVEEMHVSVVAVARIEHLQLLDPRELRLQRFSTCPSSSPLSTDIPPMFGMYFMHRHDWQPVHTLL